MKFKSTAPLPQILRSSLVLGAVFVLSIGANAGTGACFGAFAKALANIRITHGIAKKISEDLHSNKDSKADADATKAKSVGGDTTATTATVSGDDASRLITNTYSATDIRDVISDVSIAGKVTIIPDESVHAQTVSIEFSAEPIDVVVEKLALLIGGYSKKRAPGIYLLTMGATTSPFFREFAVAKVYRPKNQTASTIQMSISPSYKEYVSVDAKTNAITITAPSELTDHILSDIKEIDSPSRQFVVEALVTEITTTKNDDFGFSWSWKNFSLGKDLTLNYAIAGLSDVATLKALIQDGKASLRANPRVTAFEGREASLSVGQDTYYSILSGNVTFPTAQIQLIHTGVVLRFTGLIGDDGYLTLDLEPEVSDAVVSVGGNPTTNVRKVSTSIRVKSGDTIAIGGLVQETSTKTKTRIPFFGSLPLVGQLFTQHSNVEKKTEVIILITPTLTPELNKVRK